MERLSNLHRTGLAGVFGVLLVAATPIDGAPATLTATPRVALEAAWDSNIFNSPKNEESDYVFRARPELLLTFAVYKASLNVRTGLEAEGYARHDELNLISATKNFALGLNESEMLQISPNLKANPSLRYLETKDTGRRGILGEKPNAAGPSADIGVNGRTGTREISGSLNLEYLMTESTVFGLGGGAMSRNFTEGAAGATGLVDSRVEWGDASAKYLFTPRSYAGMFLNASHNTFAERPSTNSYSAGLSGGHFFSPEIDMDARLGATYSRQEAFAGSPEVTATSPDANLSIGYKYLNYVVKLYGSYNLTGGSVFGQMTKRMTAGLFLEDRFAEKWRWTVVGEYQKNRSALNPAAHLDLTTIIANGSFSYSYSEWLTAHLTGGGIRQVSDAQLGETVNRYSVLLGIDLGKTFELY